MQNLAAYFAGLSCKAAPARSARRRCRRRQGPGARIARPATAKPASRAILPGPSLPGRKPVTGQRAQGVQGRAAQGPDDGGRCPGPERHGHREPRRLLRRAELSAHQVREGETMSKDSKPSLAARRAVSRQARRRRNLCRRRSRAPRAAGRRAGGRGEERSRAADGGSFPTKDYDWTKHQWGFGVDATKCIGCLRCVEACKRENDVPARCASLPHLGRALCLSGGRRQAAHRQPAGPGEHRGLRLGNGSTASPTATRMRRWKRRSSCPSCATTARIRPACRYAPPAPPTRPRTAWC